MNNSDLIVSQIRQRLEILYQMVDELESSGGTPVDAYTKSQTDALLADKADKSTTYTKTQTNNEIDGAIAALDVSSTSATGHYIKSIEQVDGKINAVAELVDTTPTTGSTKLCTSGGIYDAIQAAAGGGGTDLTPVNIGNKVSTFPEEYRYLLQKHLPFTFTTPSPYAQWANIEWRVSNETASAYVCMASKIDNSTGAWNYIFTVIQKTNWSWSAVNPTSTPYQLINNIYFRQYEFGNDQVQTIAANTNLDNSQMGRYYCTAANAATATNCPTTDAFYLVAEFSTIANRIQTITTDTAIPVVYRRIKTGGTWGSWYKFEGTLVS